MNFPRRIQPLVAQALFFLLVGCAGEMPSMPQRKSSEESPSDTSHTLFQSSGSFSSSSRPSLLLSESFSNRLLSQRGWTRDLSHCKPVFDIELSKPVMECAFEAGDARPVGGSDSAYFHFPEGVEEFTIRFKERLLGDIQIGDQTVHAFMAMSDKGIHSPANSYGTFYFEPLLRQRGYEGEWGLDFQDNKALNCQYPYEDLVGITEDRSAGGCQTHSYAEPAMTAVCYGDPCKYGLYVHSGQSVWVLRSNTEEKRPVAVGQWADFTYYVRLNTPGEFDGTVALSVMRLGTDESAATTIYSERIIMRTLGPNADMKVDKILFGPWASSNKYNFQSRLADLKVWKGDARGIADSRQTETNPLPRSDPRTQTNGAGSGPAPQTRERYNR